MFRLFVCYKQPAKKNFFFLSAIQLDIRLHSLCISSFRSEGWFCSTYIAICTSTMDLCMSSSRYIYNLFFYLFFRIPLPAHLLTFFFLPRTYDVTEWEQTKQHIHPEIYSWRTQLFSFFYSTHSTRLSSIYFHASTDICCVVHVMLTKEISSHSTKIFLYL